MKKVLFITVFLLSLICLSQSKEEQKLLKKLNLEIVNRGFDMQGGAFVPYIKSSLYSEHMDALKMSGWSDALFKSGLEVGTYSEQNVVKDTENREMLLQKNLVFQGRYVFTISIGNIKITDIKQNNQLVANIHYKPIRKIDYDSKHDDLRLFIIEQLIKSNK